MGAAVPSFASSVFRARKAAEDGEDATWVARIKLSRSLVRPPRRPGEADRRRPSRPSLPPPRSPPRFPLPSLLHPFCVTLPPLTQPPEALSAFSSCCARPWSNGRGLTQRSAPSDVALRPFLWHRPHRIDLVRRCRRRSAGPYRSMWGDHTVSSRMVLALSLSLSLLQPQPRCLDQPSIVPFLRRRYPDAWVPCPFPELGFGSPHAFAVDALQSFESQWLLFSRVGGQT